MCKSKEKNKEVFMRRFILIILTGVLFCQGLSGAEWKAGFSQWRMEQALDALEEFAGEIEDIREINGNMYYAALCKRINSYGREIIPLMLRDVEDKGKDWKYRYMLMDRLLFVKGRKSEDQSLFCNTLTKILQDKDEPLNLRINSIDALSRLAGTSSLMDKAKRAEVARKLIAIASDKTEPTQIRWEIINDLDRFAKRFGDVLFEPLLSFCEDTDTHIRAISISTLVVLARFIQNDSLETVIKSFLVEKLRDEEDRLVKEQITYGIKTLKVRESIPLLLESLKSGIYCNKVEAAELLGLMKVQEAVPELISILKDGERDALLVSKVCIALGRIGDRSAIEPMREVLKGSRYGAYHGAAIGLAMLGAREATEDIEEKFLSLDGFDETLAMALLVLGGKGKVEVVKRKAGRNLRSLGGIKEVIKTVEEGKGIDIQLIERFVRR